ncbi:MAG: transcriptional regulator [Bacillota bacterium]|nr:transcriptional regulator [Bacillota bacterium]
MRGRRCFGRSPERGALARIYIIDQMIREGKYPNVPALAEKLEVSKRTVERDLEAMRDLMSAPLAYSRKRRGYFYREEFVLPRLDLSEGELIGLLLGEKLLGHYAGTPYEAMVRRALAKIELILPEHVSVDFSFLQEVISFDETPVRGDRDRLLEVYTLLNQALKERKVIAVKYYTASRGEWSSREVAPYHLRYDDGAWYLIAFCYSRGEVRIFALDRIKEIRLTERCFKIPEDFSVTAFLANSFGIERGPAPQEVVIYFDSYQARWIRERRWHPSQVIEEQEDGGVILRLKVSGLGEVRRWVLGFGSHARVMAPSTLRAEIQRELTRMLCCYT